MTNLKIFRLRTLFIVISVSLLAGNIIMAQDNPIYQEPFRPQFHYSPPCQWMNDPNGLVYYEGEYHLFYQFYPQDIVWGPMHWGHAVSPDLVHWQTLPIALFPDDIGAIWSGSIVVDANNTSGLVEGGGLIAIYSYQNQSQGIAYSTDKGRTWTKYAGNPVIGALAKDFRDPKVFWYDGTKQWIMVIAAGHELQIFTSPNLINWEMTSKLTGGLAGGVWEVPDLFPLEIEGQTKWVLLGSVSQMAPAGGGGVRYYIGDFDGRTFTYNESDPVLWLDYGPDNYAGTTFSDMPMDKRTYIGWMSNWQYAASTPTTRWRGATTLPRELRLVATSEGIRMIQVPVETVSQLRKPLGTWDNLTISEDTLLDKVQGRTLEIIAEIEPGSAERFGIDVQRSADNKTHIVYNTKQSKLYVSRSDKTDTGTISAFTPAFGAPITLANDTLRLHIFVDESSVEVFGQDGLISITGLTFTKPSDNGIALFAEHGEIKVKNLEIYSLGSIWDTSSLKLEDFDFCGK